MAKGTDAHRVEDISVFRGGTVVADRDPDPIGVSTGVGVGVRQSEGVAQFVGEHLQGVAAVDLGRRAAAQSPPVAGPGLGKGVDEFIVPGGREAVRRGRSVGGRGPRRAAAGRVVVGNRVPAVDIAVDVDLAGEPGLAEDRKSVV